MNKSNTSEDPPTTIEERRKT